MCGICGIFGTVPGRDLAGAVRNMMDLQDHRGPDDRGVFSEPGIGLGFVRLSILDLSPAANQPMFSPDGRFVLVYNGELFNYLELRQELAEKGFSFRTRGDGEVLLAAYQAWGEACLDKFNGMWAFAIYDRVQKTLFAARDRYGIKPFYYLAGPGYFAFASEIPPLLSLAADRPQADQQTVFDYLLFNRTDQSERTFFQGLKQLPHGRVLKVARQADGSIEVEQGKWYDLEARVARAVPPASPRQFRELLVDAVGLRLRSDVPVGVCLSGGLDSSSITSLLLNDFQKNDLQTFSAVYGPGQHGDESHYIQLFRERIANMHYISPSAESLLADCDRFITAQAEPLPSTGPYAQFKVMELAGRHVSVTLDGQGADEILAGYPYFFGYYFKELAARGRLPRLLAEMSAYWRRHRSAYGFKTFLYFCLPRGLRNGLRRQDRGYLDPAFYRRHAAQSLIGGELHGSADLRRALLNHFEYKLEHLLKWEDRNSMFFSVEARVPFLDHRLVEGTLALSSDLIIRDGLGKHILRQALAGDLPAEIASRVDKIGFETPQEQWFRTPAWRDYILDLISSSSFCRRDCWDAERIRRLYDQHLAGRKNLGKDIWKWINLESWFRKYID